MRLFVILLLMSPVWLCAQAPSLLKNFNFYSNSQARDFYECNNKLFFSALSDTIGREIWVVDGNNGQVQLLKDINPGQPDFFSAGLNRPQTLNNSMIFVAEEPNLGREIYTTDGTSAGTTLLKDVLSGQESSNPYDLKTIGNLVYFSAYDVNNKCQLWCTDGSTQGTTFLYTDSINNNQFYLISQLSGNTLLFAEDDGQTGSELWISDGTEAGTTLLKDINTGASGSLSGTIFNFQLNNKVYFAANDGQNGTELWVTDGTAAGTQLFKDFNTSGNTIFYTSNIHHINGEVVFCVNDGNGMARWKTDGTTAGTIKLHDIAVQSKEFVVNNKIYYRNYAAASGTQLWSTGLTPGSHNLLSNLGGDVSDILAAHNGIIYLNADNGITGRELYKHDINTGSTSLLKDIVTGASAPSWLYRIDNLNNFTLNGKVVFAFRSDNHGQEFIVSDGTTAGTQILDINPGADYGVQSTFSTNGSGIVHVFNNKLYFSGNDGGYKTDLWTTDGTLVGTQNEHIIYNGDKNVSLPKQNIKVEDDNSAMWLYVSGGDSTAAGKQIWYTDGTTAGTVRKTDFSSSIIAQSSFANHYTGTHHYIMIQNGPNNDVILGRSDGTIAGSEKLLTTFDFDNTFAMTSLNNKIYFTGRESTLGVALWEFDPLTDTCTIVKTNSSNIENMVVMNGEMYLVFTDNNGSELWKSDGTVSGTVMVKDINPNGSSSILYLTVLNNQLYFTANDGVHGSELWTSDGTAQGTYMIKDIHTAGNSFPRKFSTINNKVVFEAIDGTNGKELWVTDGTDAGTYMLNNFYPNSSNASFYNFTRSDSLLYFTVGGELWETSGTTSSNRKVQDFNPNDYEDVSQLVYTNQRLYFVAFNGSNNVLYEKSDADTNATVLMVLDKNLVGFDNMSSIKYVNGKLVFLATHSVYGNELWTYDIGSNTLSTTSVDAATEIATLFPNPNNGQFTIDFADAADASVHICNSAGQLLQSQQQDGAASVQIDMQAYPAGIYFAYVKQKHSTQILKFIKQ